MVGYLVRRRVRGVVAHLHVFGKLSYSTSVDSVGSVLFKLSLFSNAEAGSDLCQIRDAVAVMLHYIACAAT